MRQVLSISLSETELQDIKEKTKKRGFSSVSRYLIQLVSHDQDLISEDELVKAIKDARREQKLGKSIKANSIADLL